MHELNNFWISLGVSEQAHILINEFTLYGREGKREENKVSSTNSNYSAILPWEVCQIWCLLLPTDMVVSLFFLVLDKAFPVITLNTVLWHLYEKISKMNRVFESPQKMSNLSQNPTNNAYTLNWEGQTVHLNLSWGSILCSGLSLWNRNIRREKVALQVHLLLFKAKHTSMQHRLT